MKYRELSLAHFHSEKSLNRVLAVGFGCMGLVKSYRPYITDQEAISLIRQAYENGVVFFDTADQYAAGHNEEIVGQATSPFRDKIILCSKVGFFRDSGNSSDFRINGLPKYIKLACEKSLKRLNTDYLDLLYLHRKDPKVAIEESVDALADLVKEGKIRGIGLSEVSVEDIYRAQLIYPLSAVQSEYSLITRVPEVNQVLDACLKLNISLVAHCPLGRGMLVGNFSSIKDLPKDDSRRTLPRFQEGNIENNFVIVQKIKSIAQKKKISSAQLVLAWLINRAENIIPIPSTKRLSRLLENIGAANIILSEDEMRMFDAIAPVGCAYGPRCPSSVLEEWNMTDETQYI